VAEEAQEPRSLHVQLDRAAQTLCRRSPLERVSYNKTAHRSWRDPTLAMIDDCRP
jgi:hypothetical protein